MKVGVTANRNGLTPRQKLVFAEELVAIGATELHHGDCIGGDVDCHNIAKGLGLRIVIHPPLNEKQRAFCDGDEILPPDEYLARNRNIVNATEVLYGFPKYNREEQRSGTWSTIRYARRDARPYHVVLPYEPS